MIVYFILLIVLAYGIIRYDNNKHIDYNNKYLLFEWLLLVLIAGLRYKIGGDTISIMSNYDSMSTFSNLTKYSFQDTRYQPLWILFVAFVKTLNPDFVFFQFVHAIIINSVIFWFFKKHSEHVYTAILVYSIFFYLNFNTEILRASLSVCAFLVGYDFMINKRWLNFSICAIVAYEFHPEALFLLLYPFCLLTSQSSFKTGIIIVFSVCSFFLIADFLPFIGDILNGQELLFNAFNRYSEGDTFHFNFNGTILYLTKVIFWVLFMWLIKGIKNYNYIFVCYACISSLMLWKYPAVFDRFMDFAKPLLIIEFTKLLYLKGKFLKRITIIGISYCWICYYLGPWGNLKAYRKYIPYSSVIDKNEDSERNNAREIEIFR